MQCFGTAKWIVTVFWAAILLIAAGCVSDKQVISQAESVHGGLQPTVINDAELNAYVQKIGDRIIKAAKEMEAQHYGPDSHFKADANWMFTGQMKFHFVASDQLNAFTTGGEHMYVYTQLFAECHSEDALAAVMAHEFAHVYARHVQKGMNRQYAIAGASAVAGGAGYALADKDNQTAYSTSFASAVGSAGNFIGMSFTRGDEDEADRVGFQFYAHAGWDPKHFADFFQQMISKGYDATPAMMSDHPTLKSRVATVGKYVTELPPQAAGWRRPPVATPAIFPTLQDRPTQVAHSIPADKSVSNAKLLLASFPSCVSPMQTKAQQDAQTTLLDFLAQNKTK